MYNTISYPFEFVYCARSPRGFDFFRVSTSRFVFDTIGGYDEPPRSKRFGRFVGNIDVLTTRSSGRKITGFLHAGFCVPGKKIRVRGGGRRRTRANFSRQTSRRSRRSVIRLVGDDDRRRRHLKQQTYAATQQVYVGHRVRTACAGRDGRLGVRARVRPTR